MATKPKAILGATGSVPDHNMSGPFHRRDDTLVRSVSSVPQTDMSAPTWYHCGTIVFER